MSTTLPSGLWPRRGLYAITPDEADTERLLERIEPVLESGIALLQYRNKIADAALRLDQALTLQLLCGCYGVPLIINDDVALAKAIAAGGVHLGQDDGDVAAARASLGSNAIIGGSCYDSLERAQSLAEAGADYLAFGAFFPTATKPDARRADSGLLGEAKCHGLPLVAIGGIRPQNVRALRDAGADLIAVISGLWDSPDPAAAAQAYVTAFNEVP
jgi:thiamine-phosphate pyrophosphorylase